MISTKRMHEFEEFVDDRRGLAGMRRSIGVTTVCLIGLWVTTASADLRTGWPKTDFSRASIDLSEVISGGPQKDGIPSIDNPVFRPLTAADKGSSEPAITVVIDGDARAYPLGILLWHEIVNDTVGGKPVAVTYCPLCNSGIVFIRKVNNKETTFGTSGMLRHSDMIMYDRATESWWQQFVGEAIVGQMTGTVLKRVPARIESLARFATRNEDGSVLVPSDPSFRQYGRNPYKKYDTADWPMLYRGDYDGPVAPLARVVVVGSQAWPLDLVRKRGLIEVGDLRVSWQAGLKSVLDASDISKGRDVGSVIVQRKTESGYVDIEHDIPFAFAFKAFVPQGIIHTK